VHQTANPPKDDSIKAEIKPETCSQTDPIWAVFASRLESHRVGFNVLDHLKNQAIVPIEGAFYRIPPAASPFRGLFGALGAHVLPQSFNVVVVSIRPDTLHGLDDLRKEFLDST
jgi:hypothetical protein